MTAQLTLPRTKYDSGYKVAAFYQQLVESIQLLPIPQREAIVLCFEGFSYGEMGQILGMSSNAAMLRWQR